MTKPMLERYEQILAQDPSSTVFVELAKALLEKGDPARAIEVCKGGLDHHAQSIIGRVLWGKSLILLGRPAEAMEQFDLAIAIDRENPYAYNLIAEVLLNKGLYRSALPLLRRAAALQPNDARIKQWLEATQGALSGGPAPVVKDLPPLEPPPSDEDESHHHEATQVMQIPADIEALANAKARGNGARKQDEGTRPTGQQVSPNAAPRQAPRGDDDRTEAYKIPDENSGISLNVYTGPTAVPSAEVHLQKQVPTAPAPVRPSQRAPARSKSLLDEIPDLQPEASSAVEAPKVELSNHAAEAIAKEYERELRQKLEQKVQAQKKSFLARNSLKISAVVVLVVAVLAFAGFFLHTRNRNEGRDLVTLVADGKRAALQDTTLSYKEAITLLGRAGEMDSASEEVWAWKAYAHAVLYSEHGREETHFKAAQEAAGKVSSGPHFAALLKVVDFHLAEPKLNEAKAREQKYADLIQSAQAQSSASDLFGSSLLEGLVGKILFAKGDAKQALERVKQALDHAKENVRALVSLADYYRDAGDFKNALASYTGTTAQLSPKHPQRVLGAAFARLELGQELPEALAEVEALPSENVSPPLRAHKELIHARLLSATGKHAEAIAKLTAALKAHKDQAYALNLGLGEVYRNAGDAEAASKVLETALKLRDTTDVREELGRVLLMRDRDRELLLKIPPSDDRRLSLLRGIALVRIDDPKRARAELAKTQLAGKFPSEAVIYLALADAAEGQADKAQEVLEKTLDATRKSKAEVRVALGQVYWQRGALDKARVQFEEAVKEPNGYEAGCALGRLLLSLGFADQAIDPLLKSVTRNGAHTESRTALGNALLALGKPGEAVKQFEAWAAQSPTSLTAHKLLARAQYEQGLIKEADVSINKALKLEGAGTDSDTHRIRAGILFGRGEGKAAFGELEKANKLNPKDPNTFCEIGMAFLRRGAVDNAARAYYAAKREDAKSSCAVVGKVFARGGGGSVLKDLTEQQKIAPTSWDRAFAAATVAKVQLGLGKAKEARKAAEDAVSLAPGQGRAYWILSMAALKQRDETKAKEAITRALELEPEYGQVHLTFADLLARGGAAEVERAIAEYETYLKLGAGPDEGRVKKLLPLLKKKMASR
ncbi:MAG: tetratricopeptide repeat protein [Myxococcaceae bacterium]